jgi:hypothetical protein
LNSIRPVSAASYWIDRGTDELVHKAVARQRSGRKSCAPGIARSVDDAWRDWVVLTNQPLVCVPGQAVSSRQR